jgi:O-acetyl-ADP-ribose deacetylase (regulator of RNase III)
MIKFTSGNLFDADVDVLVNTVNTVGVMGKGIALMFKERFPENFRLYAAACKAKEVQTGKMFVTKVNELDGPTWIVNFPTKQHWRASSQISWVKDGLKDLREFLVNENIESIAIPPLGAGNGGLEWEQVKPEIVGALSDLDVDILVFEPTEKYQNIEKKAGVEKLTPARALIADLVRRYWVLGMECSILEVQKLAWFLERAIEKLNPDDNPLKLQFSAHHYGPYANRLQHLLNNLDGSYLHCNKRISDADPLEVVWFDEKRKNLMQAYLGSEAKRYQLALESTAELIDGFESPFGMELLATVDWLLHEENVDPTVSSVREAIKNWRGGKYAAERKSRIFDDRSIRIALDRLLSSDVFNSRLHST